MTPSTLTIEQVNELTPWQKLWLMRNGLIALPVIAGAEDPPEDEDESEDELDVTGDDEDEDESGDEHESGSGGGESHIQLREGEQVVSKAEFERYKRLAKEAEDKAKKAEREARRAAEKEQRDAGNWEELLRERDERIQESEAERDAARLDLETTLRNHRITAAANRLGFKDPEDAGHFLSEDETQDDPSTERALKRLMREKPYLVEPRRSSAAPANGEGAMLTMEEIKRMSPDQVNARWSEVQAAMAAAGGGS